MHPSPYLTVVLFFLCLKLIPTRSFKLKHQVLCFVTQVTVCLQSLHAWRSLNHVNDPQKAWLYIDYTVGCVNTRTYRNSRPDQSSGRNCRNSQFVWCVSRGCQPNHKPQAINRKENRVFIYFYAYFYIFMCARSGIHPLICTLTTLQGLFCLVIPRCNSISDLFKRETHHMCTLSSVWNVKIDTNTLLSKNIGCGYKCFCANRTISQLLNTFSSFSLCKKSLIYLLVCLFVCFFLKTNK